MSFDASNQTGGSFSVEWAWGSLYEYSENPSYDIEDTIHIAWTWLELPVFLNLYLWQANSTTAMAFLMSNVIVS